MPPLPFFCAFQVVQKMLKYPPAIDAIKPYFPQSLEAAKTEMLDFLATTQYAPPNRAKTETDYPDRTPTEGLFVLEGSANYLKNNNLSLRQTADTTYTLAVNNTTTNGELKMSGTDLTAKFNQLFDNITAYETTTEQTAMLADATLKTIDNTTTQLDIKVVYGRAKGSGIALSSYTFEDAADIVTDAVNANYCQSISGGSTVGCWFGLVNSIPDGTAIYNYDYWLSWQTYITTGAYMPMGNYDLCLPHSTSNNLPIQTINTEIGCIVNGLLPYYIENSDIYAYYSSLFAVDVASVVVDVEVIPGLVRGHKITEINIGIGIAY